MKSRADVSLNFCGAQITCWIPARANCNPQEQARFQACVATAAQPQRLSSYHVKFTVA